MSFSKAVQKIEGQDEYAAAYNLYCKQCSLNKKIQTKLKARTDPEGRLMFLEQQELFREQCRVYHKAKDKWYAQRIQSTLKEQNLSLQGTGFDIARILAINVPTTGKQLIDEERKQRTLASLPADFLEQMAKAKEQLEREEQALNKAKESVGTWNLGTDDEDNPELNDEL